VFGIVSNDQNGSPQWSKKHHNSTSETNGVSTTEERALQTSAPISPPLVPLFSTNEIWAPRVFRAVTQLTFLPNRLESIFFYNFHPRQHRLEIPDIANHDQGPKIVFHFFASAARFWRSKK